jgi:Rhodopirellula transposase DDE domain
MQISEAEKEMYIETAKQLKGQAKRLYMARVVKALGRGGAWFASQAFGWDRNTIRKGRNELETGFICYDNYGARGRQRAEERLPHLLDDLRTIAEQHSQADPKFQSNRLYLRLSASSVRQQLIEQKGYTAEQLPSPEVVRQRLNELGYHLKRVKKVNR